MKCRRLLFVAVLLGILFFTAFPSVSISQAQDGNEGNKIDLDHPYAAFLESRAYGTELGATAEFRKMEYVAIDLENNILYMSMSEITRSMSDEEGDIQLPENACGIVYAAQLDAEMNATELYPLVIGGPFDETAEENGCDLDNVANPDNLAVDGRGRVWIGEDTGYHTNNVLWVYDPADGSLKRFATLPLGAEVTGLRVAPDGTLFMNVQHPSADNPEPFNAGTVGVVVGFNANADDFESIPVPEGPAQQTAVVAAGQYQVLGRVGDPIPNSEDGDIFGQVRRADGTVQEATEYDGSLTEFCNNPDGNSFLPTGENSGYLLSNYECFPGGVSQLSLTRNDDGTWTVESGKMLDFSAVNGAWYTCGASVTPWGTGIVGEEADIDANDLEFPGIVALSDYLGRQASHYDYGWVMEVAPDMDGTTIVKHYAMGRRSNENATIAADEKTVYFGDDGSNVMAFKFVADEASDLSSGTLYAAKVTQLEDSDLGHRFGLEWIELGHGEDAEIEAAIRELDYE
jgi:secreted PhoX family phosphatase